MATAEEDLRRVTLRIDRFEDAFRTFAEFGVFPINDDTKRIVRSIAVARLLAAEGDGNTARYLLTQGELVFNTALCSLRFPKRYRTVHQLPLFAYYLASLLLLLNVATGFLSPFAENLWTDPKVPMSAAIAGGLGATLRGLWFLWMKVSRREFRVHQTLAHLAAPWIGILLGIFAHLLITSGLLVITGSSSQGGTTFVLAFCFIVGYKWEGLLDWVDHFKLQSSKEPPVSPAIKR